MNIKDVVKDNTIHFLKYRQGHIYYSIKVQEVNYSFPVPLDDIGDATFDRNDKAIRFMRWIRKALEDGTFVKLDS